MFSPRAGGVLGLVMLSGDANGVGETVGEPGGVAADATSAAKTANPNDPILRIF